MGSLFDKLNISLLRNFSDPALIIIIIIIVRDDCLFRLKSNFKFYYLKILGIYECSLTAHETRRRCVSEWKLANDRRCRSNYDQCGLISGVPVFWTLQLHLTYDTNKFIPRKRLSEKLYVLVPKAITINLFLTK